MSFEDGFNLPNVFKEGKTADPPVRISKRRGRKGKGRNGFEFGMKKKKALDSIENMQKDSVIQSKGLGIDKPKQSLGIPTFDQNLPKQPNPLEFQEHDREEQNPFNMGLELDAGFKQPRVEPQQKRNPLNVGLQVGNLGVDSFDTKKSAFSGNTIDIGIGATPKPRSALAGASNLGGDFIARTRGRDRTGLQGGGKQDFLEVSGKSFAGVPQILPSGADQSPTVAGARARALAKAGLTDKTPQLNPLQGISSLAGGIGRAGAGFRQTEIVGGKKVLTSTGRIVKGVVEGERSGKLVRKVQQKDFNPFNVAGRRRVARREQEQIDQFTDADFNEFAGEEREKQSAESQRTRQRDFEEEFEEVRESAKTRRQKAREQAERDQDFEQASQGFSEEVIRQKIIRKRGLVSQSSGALPEELPVTVIRETKKQREANLRNQIQTPRIKSGRRTPSNITLFPSSATASPINRKFDTDGDGDIENIQGIPPSVFGRPVRTPVPKTRKEEQGFLSNAELKKELSAKDSLSKIFVRKSRPNLTIGELNETDNPNNIDLNEGETLDSTVSDSEFLSAGLDDQLPRGLQKDFNRKLARARKREE